MPLSTATSCANKRLKLTGKSAVKISFNWQDRGRFFRQLRLSVRGTPAARRELGELSFAPAPVLQAAAGGLSNNRWSLAGLTPSSTVRRLSALDRLGSARPVRSKNIMHYSGG